MFQPTPTCLSVGDPGAGGAGRAPSRWFQPTPTCLSVGDHTRLTCRRGRPRCFNPRPPVCRWATPILGRSSAVAQFQPTPTCLSVGDPVAYGSSVERCGVSTHAHLSVGGRPRRRRRRAAIREVSTHAHLSVGGRPVRCWPIDGRIRFNPRPPVCRWATPSHRVGAHRNQFQPTPTCLSVGDRAPLAATSKGPGFNPRPPVCRWATRKRALRLSFEGSSVRTHAHLSVGGRPPPRDCSRRRRTCFNPRPPVCRWATTQVASRDLAAFGFNPRPPVCRWATSGSPAICGRESFQPTPTCLSVGDRIPSISLKSIVNVRFSRTPSQAHRPSSFLARSSRKFPCVSATCRTARTSRDPCVGPGSRGPRRITAPAARTDRAAGGPRDAPSAPRRSPG